MSEREQIIKITPTRQTTRGSMSPSMTQSSLPSPRNLFLKLVGELLSVGNRVRFRANGKSMHPTIKDGEMVTVEPVEPSDVRQGDIILYRNHQSLVAHRVVAIAGARGKGSALCPPPSAFRPHSLFFLRGDALPSYDNPVETSQILGKVVSVERDGRSIELNSGRAKLRQFVWIFASRLRRAMRQNGRKVPASSGTHVLGWAVAFLALALLLSPSAYPSISFVQNIGTTSTATFGTTMVITNGATAVTAGDSIIVSFVLNNAPSGAVSCTDNATGGANTYTIDVDVTNASHVRTVICSAHNVRTLPATTGKITITHPSIGRRAASASEFFGLATSATRDQTATGTGLSTANALLTTALTPTTAQDSELLVSAFGFQTPNTNVFTVGSGYMALSSAGTSGHTTDVFLNPEYNIASAASTFAGTGRISVAAQWAAGIATYKGLVADPQAPGATTALGFSADSGGTGASQPYVNVPDAASLDPASITVEAWVYLQATRSFGAIAMKTTNDSWADGYGMHTEGSTLVWWINAYNATYRATGTISTGAWTHVAGTFDGTNLNLYIDGNLVASTLPGVGITQSTGSLKIGAGGSTPCCSWNGFIDEVRIWNVAQTQADIQTNMHLSDVTGTGLVGYWKFNDAAGTSATDSSGNLNTGTLTNETSEAWTPSAAPAGADGKFVSTTTATSVGPAGGTLQVTITSVPDNANNLGIYQYGTTTGGTVSSGETFPSGIVSRSNLVWGAVSRGTVTADMVFSYNAIPGIDPTTVVLLTRTDQQPPGTTWTEVTLSSRDDVMKTLTVNTVTTFNAEYALGYTAAPTAVKLISFTANRYDDGRVLLQWQTGYEVHNLGFNLYRKEGDSRVRINPSLVAGSALLVGSTQFTGRSYAWWDDSVLGLHPPLLYWLEDVDLNGHRTLYGPIAAVASVGSAPPGLASAPLLNRLGAKTQPAGVAFRAERSAATTPGQPQTQSGSPVQLFANPHGTQEQLRTQWALAAGRAVKIAVRHEGWYRVTQPALVAAGLDPRVNPRYLQLFVDGEEIPMVVDVEAQGRLSPRYAIEFYGLGLDTPWTDTHSYWVVAGTQPGKRVTNAERARLREAKLQEVPGQESQPELDVPQSHLAANERYGQISSSFLFTVERKDRTTYVAALLNGDAESFFGAVVSTEPVQQILTVQHLASTAPGEAQLELALQGVTAGQHRVSIQLNGYTVEPAIFEGQQLGTIKAQIPRAWLHEGENPVVLASEGGETDLSVVDYIRLTYGHSYTAELNTLRFTTSGQNQLTVHGFGDWQIRVMDVTDPANVQAIPGEVRPEGTGYGITVSVHERGMRTLLAFSEASIQTPAGVTAHHLSTWHEVRTGYDEVIIANAAFLKSASLLAALRELQGLSVAVVDVQDLYDEFNYGAKDPSALKNFLTKAQENWKKPPRFLLLVGDASFDPRNYLGLGDFDFVPTKLVNTAFLKTASDDWYVDPDSDSVPRIPVGRLPVRTPSEADRVVSKILDYEQAGGAVSWAKNVLLVADRNEGFNFEAASARIKTLLPGDAQVSEILRGQTDDATARSMLLGKLNEGQALVNYVGHGSVELWQGNLLTSEEARTLTNGSRLPFVVAMTCLNGYFQDLYTESLAKALLKAEHGGAVAVWASSGLTEPAGQTVMNQALVPQIFGESPTIGEATVKAKAAVNDLDIRRTWIFFGDPATKLAARDGR